MEKQDNKMHQLKSNLPAKRTMKSDKTTDAAAAEVSDQWKQQRRRGRREQGRCTFFL